MIAPDTTHIQTKRPQRRTTYLIYPQPISVSGLMVLSPKIAGVLFYATSARTQYHFPTQIDQFHPASPQRSQSFIMPLDGACNITPLAHSCSCCLYKLPVLLHPPKSCLLPPCPKCCMDNLVLYCCLYDMAQLSFHWIPGHCDICSMRSRTC